MRTIRLFRHHVHKAYMILALIEALLFTVAVYLGASLRFIGEELAADQYFGAIFPHASIFTLSMMVSMTAMGMYQPHMREGSSGILLRTLGAFLLMGLMLSVIYYLVPTLLLWRGVVAWTAICALLFTLVSRLIFAKLIDEDRLKRRVLVFGAGNTANKVVNRLRRKSDRRGFRFVGFIPIEGEPEVIDPERILRLDGGICDYVRSHRVDEIIVAVDDRRRGLPIEELLECKLNGVEVHDLVSFFEREAGRIMLEFVTPGWMVFSDGFQFGSVKAVGKRLFDFAASFILLMVTWPIMLLTVFAIWLEDGIRAPIVYRQQRVGLGGQLFDVLKFRSMTTDAEKDGKAVWAKKNDARVTRVGSFIRKCRIDELPQIINVLAGDMAFVGPRPERPQFVQQLTEAIPYYAARHQVKPGIAGWAQLRYPYGADENDAKEKLQFDLYYVKNNSVFLDFLILISTVEIVLFGTGAR